VNDNQPEPTVRDRIDEHPKLDLGKVAKARPRDLLIRFIAGALVSIVSGTVSLTFGARAGGILLAFPAILAASLTLIEQQEDSVDAREDARGAIAGGFALAVFAAVAAVTFGHVGGALALAIAAVAWVVAAGMLYVVLWWR
jgi:uncharacterized membrane protein (GlpM family)